MQRDLLRDYEIFNFPTICCNISSYLYTFVTKPKLWNMNEMIQTWDMKFQVEGPISQCNYGLTLSSRKLELSIINLVRSGLDQYYHLKVIEILLKEDVFG